MKNERSVSTVAALLVLAVFAAGVLSVLLSGASAYQRLTKQDQSSYESRTATQYLATKLRQAESPDAVAVATFAGLDALQITTVIEGAAYVTRIYCYDGWLMELFCAEDNAMAPEDGEKILPAAAMQLQQSGGLVTVRLTAEDGTVQTLSHSIRGWQP